MTTHMLDARVRDVIQSSHARRIALMLYGSVARGTADVHSDVDILELVTRDAHAYKMGDVNVTQYEPAHIHAMASQGSLFVLHLRQDGVTLADTFGVLARALASYVQPRDYGHVWGQLAVAAGVLDPSSKNAEQHVAGLARLGIYILRTAAYLRGVELGTPEFDIDRLVDILGDQKIGQALALRRKQSHTMEDIALLSEQIAKLVPGVGGNDFGTVEAYAVAHSTRSDLAGLFGAVIGGDAVIDYSALTLPPF